MSDLITVFVTIGLLLMVLGGIAAWADRHPDQTTYESERDALERIWRGWR